MATIYEPGIADTLPSRPSPFVQLERDPRTGEWIIRGMPGGGGTGGVPVRPTLPGANPSPTTALPPNIVSENVSQATGFWGRIGSFFNSPGGQIATNALGTLGSAWLQGRASDRASEAMAQTAREALEFEKSVYENDVKDYQGLKGEGDKALARMGDMLGRERTPVSASDVFGAGDRHSTQTLGALRQPPRSVGSGATPAAAGMQPITPGLEPGAGQMVRMQAPDGEIRLVRPESVAKYEARGVRRI